MRPKELDWMYGGGVGMLRPLSWNRFLDPLSEAERLDPLLAYYTRLLSRDPAVVDAAVSDLFQSGFRSRAVAISLP